MWSSLICIASHLGQAAFSYPRRALLYIAHALTLSSGSRLRLAEIAQRLNREGQRTTRGNRWTTSSLWPVLQRATKYAHAG